MRIADAGLGSLWLGGDLYRQCYGWCFAFALFHLPFHLLLSRVLFLEFVWLSCFYCYWLLLDKNMLDEMLRERVYMNFHFIAEIAEEDLICKKPADVIRLSLLLRHLMAEFLDCLELELQSVREYFILIGNRHGLHFL
jgi:hypothetical protein